jgi:UDP-2-acetamido-3-amino-2,3-dideoxy-glucuronate N-acetyltransferase
MVRVACLGAGYWGKNLVRNFNELGALDTICDTNPETIEAFRKLYPKRRFRTTLAEVLADKRIDAVAVATPAETHYDICREAILAGKDVYVEKPVSLRVEDGEALTALAEERGRILMIGHILEYHPGVIKLKELVDSGELGRIHYIYSNRSNLGKVRTEENILWSFAPHDISVILMLLGEMPTRITAVGGAYIHRDIADITMSTLSFASGVKAHIFVSWLHPYKEQRLVVVGDRKMAVFDDVSKTDKLQLHDKHVDWVQRRPTPHKDEVITVPFEAVEPLRAECQHFIECVAKHERARTDGRSGVRVLRVLDACQRSLGQEGIPVTLEGEAAGLPYTAHSTAVVDPGAAVGADTKVWHFSHVMKGANVGRNCNLGQNVVISPGVIVGDGCKIQNNVSLYTGVTLEEDVFCGPSCVFTNVINPRSHVPRKHEFRSTVVKRGATIGANATIVCGITLGRYSFVGAGAVVTRDVPDYGLVTGVPGKLTGFVCECGVKLDFEKNRAKCAACAKGYVKKGSGVTPA